MNKEFNKRYTKPEEEIIEKTEKPTSYFHALVHLIKGSMGSGLFAMGFAFKYGGLALAAVLTVTLAIICIHCQHVLVKCSVKVSDIRNLKEFPDYAETVELCFENGPESTRKCSKSMRRAVNIFICITQLGFCCVYFVFIGENVNQIVYTHTSKRIDVRLIMLAAFLPIWLSCLITNLKYLTPVSGFAALCMVVGIIGTIAFALKDGYINDIDKRNLYNGPLQLAIYFGTAIFAFEGIALVLPIKNSMAKPETFEQPLGVLNVSMFIVVIACLTSGIVGYAKWGEDVEGSLTLNLGNSIVAEVIKTIVLLGILFGFALQFHVAIQIMLPRFIHFVRGYNHQFAINLIFRTIVVIFTLIIAVIVPTLGLFIALIGSICSTALALVFPPLIDSLMLPKDSKVIAALIIIKNTLILILAFVGFTVGSYTSVYEIIVHFKNEYNNATNVTNTL